MMRSDAETDNHRVTETWMGEEVDTLEDLLRPGLRAVCVGINPSPVSVQAGHYYQGQVGQRFFSRLHAAGVLPSGDGCEDDRAFQAGVGVTDIIKRPSARAHPLRAAEYEHGEKILAEKLATFAPPLVVFTFKKTAEVVFGKFPGNGFVPGLHLGTSDVFVMPGPYENAATAAATVEQLRLRWVAL